ncbi:MAG TPA: hypothetical protein PLE72_10425, partial [Azospira sp.]|nr:hypothetical protein [Azospira sp.]
MIKPYSPIAGPVVGGGGFQERMEGTLREDKHQIKPVPRTETTKEKGRPEYRAALTRNPEIGSDRCLVRLAGTDADHLL